MNFEEKKDLYRVRHTTLEMLQDRNYVVPEDLLSLTFEQFAIQHEERNIDIYIEDQTNNKKIYVFFQMDVSFGKNDMKSLVDKIIKTYEDDNIQIMLMLKEKENNSILKEKSKNLYRNVEVFYQKAYKINITKHIFQPKFIMLTPEEEAEVLEKYQTPKSKFQILPQSDPVAKYYGMKTEQMCKIIRTDREVGYGFTYRVVR